MSREVRPGIVYMVGAGPGDPDLLTVRARRVLRAADLVLYADSLVDPRMLEVIRAGARVRATSGMTLEPIVDEMVAAARAGAVVARLHSGDPGVYGALAEQLALLDGAGVDWEVIPGVPSPMAAAARVGCELTVPATSQAIVFCRVAGRTPMPEGQDLRALARPGVSLCIFLGAAYGAEMVGALRDGGIDDRTPALIAERVAWPDERISVGTVGNLARRLTQLGIRRHALVLVGPAFARAPARLRSSLYSADHAHVFRPTGDAARGEVREAGAVAVYALTAEGAALAARIAAGTPQARLHLPTRLAGAHRGAVAEARSARAVVARLMASAGSVILVMATGAAVRLIAPHLADKLRDPAVVAVDDRGRNAVPLAGAHAGGANRLARRVADILGANAVISTASDGRGWPALDELARRWGWRIENSEQLAAVTTALLDGEPVGLAQECGRPLETAGRWPPTLRRYADVERLRAATERARIAVTDRRIDDAAGLLVLRPPTVVLGIGCEAGVGDGELAGPVGVALGTVGLSASSVRAVATLDRKCAEPALRRLCAEHGWELLGLTAERLRAVPVPTPSPVVEAAVGTPSVSEAAALLAAAEGSELVGAKLVAGRVTVAVARRG